MAQQERAIRTRRAVIEAAAMVFAERGYTAATMAEILQRAGVTKGALYFHFDSKEALARGVIEEQVDPERWVPRDLRLQEWVDVGMTLAHRIPGDVILLAGIRLSADTQGRARFGSAWPAWTGLITTFLTEAKERGEVLPHVDPAETAECFLGAWVGTQLVSEAESGYGDLERRISVLYNHVLPAIATPAALIRLDTAPDRGARVLAEVRNATDTQHVSAEA
ncbi:ScbR family autoregulator-binding transcription factor [Streptomyces sp. RTGN2]|uniref:ScbR family autoregulator-binding transcription factor n=1 Tax=unclassified Streptomyces TaxID=2593676 RepID=UPI0025552978|nr:ScbR family autoregulator-binding transcription factor [Streptomyces sp. RTGN2]